MSNKTKTYFASDFHLGLDAKLTSAAREKQLLRWLEMIRKDAAALYLVGDIFDFWFEYKTVVPKGYVRLLGKLAELRDEGLPIYFFIGNHDMWVFDYFEEELGITTYRKPIITEIGGKTFFIGHGDGLGPKDYGYKLLKKVFANPVCQWLFARLHPNFGIGLANFWSKRSRAVTEEEKFLGEDKEWLIAYCERKLSSLSVDYFVFGHRHLPIEHTLSNGKSQYVNLGDWLSFNSYGVFDGEEMRLAYFEENF